MNRQSISVTAGFTTVLLFLTGCSGLSSYRDDLAIQAMAKRSFARREASCPVGPFSKDYERGWRQAYFDISHGGTGCPPSVPPEVYWSTKYQNPQGCQHISAWYDGYRCGSTAAMAECRSSFAKVPVMANCIRPSAVDCSPVETCREPLVPEWQQFGSMPASADAGADEMLAEAGQEQIRQQYQVAQQLEVRPEATKQDVPRQAVQTPIVGMAVMNPHIQPAEVVTPFQVLPPQTHDTGEVPSWNRQQIPTFHKADQPTAHTNPFPPLASLAATDDSTETESQQNLPIQIAVDAQSSVKAAAFGQADQASPQVIRISYPKTISSSSPADTPVRLPSTN